MTATQVRPRSIEEMKPVLTSNVEGVLDGRHHA